MLKENYLILDYVKKLTLIYEISKKTRYQPYGFDLLNPETNRTTTHTLAQGNVEFCNIFKQSEFNVTYDYNMV